MGEGTRSARRRRVGRGVVAALTVTAAIGVATAPAAAAPTTAKGVAAGKAPKKVKLTKLSISVPRGWWSLGATQR